MAAMLAPCFSENVMPFFHAVVLVDHHSALIQQFDTNEVHAEKVKDHRHYTRQHNSGVRTEHRFFAEVCDALSEVTEILVTGSHTAQADFKHYVEKHRPALSPKIVGWETVDHPSDGQLVALAKTFFAKYDRMRGLKTPP
jgi:stalled ribosome rescue protein Dom34